MSKQPNALAIFSRGAQMLAEATTIQKNKELKDLGITAAEWARRKGMGEDAVAHARAFALDAECQMGRLLKEAERNRGGRPKKTSTRKVRVSNAPTLEDLGITKKESSAAQKLVSLPKQMYQKIRDGVVTRAAAQREMKEAKREKERKANAQKVKASQKPQELKAIFSTIVIDPPWDWSDEGDVNQLGRAKPDYATMTIEQLQKLPVATLAAEDCHLYCWVTNRSLPKVFGLLDTWGFRYIVLLTWPKTSYGMGNYFRGQTEHVAFGIRGSLALKVKSASTLLPTWKRGQGHSSKPTEFLGFVEKCSPGPYLEMFARSKRENWTAWGCDV